jgi:hypothetical protein
MVAIENTIYIERQDQPSTEEFFDGIFMQSVNIIKSEVEVLDEKSFLGGDRLPSLAGFSIEESGLLLRTKIKEYAFLKTVVNLGPIQERQLLIGVGNRNFDALESERLRALVDQPVEGKMSIKFHTEKGMVIVNCSRDFRTVLGESLENSSRQSIPLAWENYMNALDVAAQVLGF